MKNENPLRAYIVQITAGLADGWWDMTITAKNDRAAIAQTKQLVARSAIARQATTVYLWDDSEVGRCVAKWNMKGTVKMWAVPHK